MEIVDHRLIGALHVALTDRAGARDLPDGGAVFQTATLEALLDGVYEGDLTIGELLRHGDLGIGTVDHLDGELVVVDGRAHVATVDGRLRDAPADEGTPFAVVCAGPDGPALPLPACSDLAGLTGAVDACTQVDDVVAVRVDGRFTRLVLRSVARQEPPYPPLREVVALQHEWVVTDLDGTLVGFRFPDRTGGLEVPGWHLHFVDAARRTGGHVIDAALDTGTLRWRHGHDLHVEVPASVRTGGIGGADRLDEIAAVEGHGGPPTGSPG